MPTFQKIIETVKTPKDGQNQRIALIKEIEQITNRRLLYMLQTLKNPLIALSHPRTKLAFQI